MAGAGTTSAFTFQDGGPIESIEHFLAEIRRFAGQGDHRLYFRGHGEPTAGLMPSIGRRHFYLGRSLIFDRETESRLLQQFRRYAWWARRRRLGT